jgi:LysR family glycine cleavage system transcriptional activator
MDAPLNSLRAFAFVVAEGGIRPAARRLGVSHSAVSRHVAELEAWLGRPLFQRDPAASGLVPTAEGKRLAQATMASLSALERAISGIRGTRRTGAVSVSTTASIASRWLLPRLPLLRRAHPRIELSVAVEPAPVAPDGTSVDLALRMGTGPWPGVHAERWMDDALYPVMGRILWEREGKPRALAALLRLPLLHDRDPNAQWDAWRSAFGPAGLDCSSGPRYESTELVLRAASVGLGVALARDRLVRDDLASGALVRPFGPHAVALSGAYWIVTPEAVRPRAAVRTVIQWLRAEAEAQAV